MTYRGWFRSLGLTLAFLALATPLFAQQGQVVDRVIAVVNDEIILESEVLQYVQDIVLRDRSHYTTQAQVDTLRSQVLQELINQKILLAIAEKDTNIKVEDRQIDQTLDDRINQIEQQIGGEDKLVAYYGKPIRQIRREFRKQVRDNLMVEKVRAQKLQGVSVTKQEVEDYYNENKDQMPEVPERVHLAHILINIEPTKAAQEAAKAKADSLFNRLMLGDNFEDLAMKYSDDRASGAKGGLLGTTERGDLVPEYEEVAFGLNDGEISEPIKSRFGYHIIRLNWRRGEKINTSHILIRLVPTKADEQRAAEFARSLKDSLDQGASFADLAKRYSQDKDTAPNGGDLGWFDLSTMPSDFKTVAKDLKPGEVSNPFRTRLGIHLLELIDRQPARKVNLQKDWERISQLALLKKQDEVFQKWIKEKRKEVYIDIKKD